MASVQPAKITKFDIISNGGATISLLGKGGLPLVEYREGIFDHTVRIHAIYMDSDGSLDKMDLQGDEKVNFSVTHDGKTLSFNGTLRLHSYHTTYDSLKYVTELYIVTKDFLDNVLEETKVVRFYSGKISDNVTSILQECLRLILVILYYNEPIKKTR